MYLEQAKDLLADANFVRGSELSPCTPEEVRTLEEHIAHTLPQAYREFLLWMGHGAGPFLRGTSVFYGDLPDQGEAAEELLQENAIEAVLPKDAFVFYMHQGYQLMFFRLSEGDDPPVYYYGEGESLKSFKLLYPKFSVFIMTEINGHKALIEMLERDKQRRKSR